VELHCGHQGHRVLHQTNSIHMVNVLHVTEFVANYLTWTANVSGVCASLSARLAN